MMEGSNENKQADQVKDLPEVPGSLAGHAAPALGPVGVTPENPNKQ